MFEDIVITTSKQDDYFVGLRFLNDKPEVVFPHGYNLKFDDESELRKDCYRLLSVLTRFTNLRDGNRHRNEGEIQASFPIASYQYVIQDYLTHGYYIEKETRYERGSKVKIDWRRTIQKEQPQINNGNLVYLQFQTRTNKIKENNLVTLIHKYCVYQSFYRFGWMYFTTDYLPPKPEISGDVKQFIPVIRQRLEETFNDEKRKLFQSMINIIEDADEIVDIKDLSIGVKAFDKVWERLIDHIFGEDNKEDYFPHATWHVLDPRADNLAHALQPDTIMKDKDGKLFVLDAKYYQYGLHSSPLETEFLPQSSDIQKQVTYGKHIAEDSRFPDNDDVYNAFILPYNGHQDGGYKEYEVRSIATTDWEMPKKVKKNYPYVLAIQVDTKHILSTYTKHNEKEIEILAEKIEQTLLDFRKNFEK